MTATLFNHTHGSGRYDRSPATLLAAVTHYIDAGCSLITVTEVSKEAREAALRTAAQNKGWKVITGDKGGMDDAGIMWDTKVFTLVTGGTHVLSGYTYGGKGGGVVYAAWAVLNDKNNHKLLVLVAHQASGVERDGGLKGGIYRVRKWRKDTVALKHLWNRLADEHKPTGIIVTCDWNVNIKRWYFRSLFKRMYPGMTLVPHKPWPTIGTLGTRLIDFSFVRGTIKGHHVIVHPQNSSSDHRPFTQSITLG